MSKTIPSKRSVKAVLKAYGVPFDSDASTQELLCLWASRTKKRDPPCPLKKRSDEKNPWLGTLVWHLLNIQDEVAKCVGDERCPSNMPDRQRYSSCLREATKTDATCAKVREEAKKREFKAIWRKIASICRMYDEVDLLSDKEKRVWHEFVATHQIQVVPETDEIKTLMNSLVR